MIMQGNYKEGITRNAPIHDSSIISTKITMFKVVG
jgi:hypothetical protein